MFALMRGKNGVVKGSMQAVGFDCMSLFRIDFRSKKAVLTLHGVHINSRMIVPATNLI